MLDTGGGSTSRNTTYGPELKKAFIPVGTMVIRTIGFQRRRQGCLHSWKMLGPTTSMFVFASAVEFGDVLEKMTQKQHNWDAIDIERPHVCYSS